MKRALWIGARAIIALILYGIIRPHWVALIVIALIAGAYYFHSHRNRPSQNTTTIDTR
jgi:hypothetical protein